MYLGQGLGFTNSNNSGGVTAGNAMTVSGSTVNFGGTYATPATMTQESVIDTGTNEIVLTSLAGSLKIQPGGTLYFIEDLAAGGIGPYYESTANNCQAFDQLDSTKQAICTRYFDNASGNACRTFLTKSQFQITRLQDNPLTPDPDAVLQVEGRTKTNGIKDGSTNVTWNFGNKQNAAVVLDNTQYVEVVINGSTVKLAVVN